MRVRVMNLRAILVSLGVLVACSDSSGPRFGAGDASAMSACSSNAQCDDRIACTRDVCVVGGVCEHLVDNSMCTAPQVCMVGVGCAAPGARRCARTADCDDSVACTRDTCLVDGTCRNTPQDSECPSGQTCRATGCGTGMTTPGTCRMSSDCDDRLECTEDTCSASGQCVNVAQNARCGAGRVCRAGMGCVAERSCSSDRDCDDGLRCNGAERCTELACAAGTPVNCDDGMACTIDTCVEGDAGMCSHAMDPSCMSMAGRSGLYQLSPAIQYSCPGFLDLRLQDVQFSRAGGRLTVTGGPAPMTGSLPTGRAFTVTGMRGNPDAGIGECLELFTMEGNFIDDRSFVAVLSFGYPPLVRGLCSLVCGEQRWMVRGTLQ